MHKMYIETDNQEILSEYKNLLKLHKENLSNAKKQYNDNLLNSSSNISKAAWSIFGNTKWKNLSTPRW
jgi:hypothetical protein